MIFFFWNNKGYLYDFYMKPLFTNSPSSVLNISQSIIYIHWLLNNENTEKMAIKSIIILSSNNASSSQRRWNIKSLLL